MAIRSKTSTTRRRFQASSLQAVTSLARIWTRCFSKWSKPRPSQLRRTPMPVTEDEGGRRSRTLRCALLENLFAVCQLPSDAPIPEWALSGELLSITRATDELSIVCLAQNVPAGVKADGPWICLKL